MRCTRVFQGTPPNFGQLGRDVHPTLAEWQQAMAERKVMARRKITDKVREEDYEVSIRNHKDTDIVVRVVEHPRGYWSVVTSSHEYEKKEANLIEFAIPVATDGETVLAYTIRYEY